MKKISYLILILSTQLVHAQQTSIEKNLTEVQIGLFGINVNYETKLVDKLSLRISAELQPNSLDNNFYGKTEFIISPIINIEPRFYYNFKTRAKKGKNNNHNAANYFSLQMQYMPDWFVISNIDNLQSYNQINFIPTYGFRRNFSEKFNYEFKFGYGYGTLIDSNYKASGRVIDLSFKVGYVF